MHGGGNGGTTDINDEFARSVDGPAVLIQAPDRRNASRRGAGLENFSARQVVTIFWISAGSRSAILLDAENYSGDQG